MSRNVEHIIPAHELLYELYLNGVLEAHAIVGALTIDELEGISPDDIEDVTLEIHNQQAHLTIVLGESLRDEEDALSSGA